MWDYDPKDDKHQNADLWQLSKREKEIEREKEIKKEIKSGVEESQGRRILERLGLGEEKIESLRSEEDIHYEILKHQAFHEQYKPGGSGYDDARNEFYQAQNQLTSLSSGAPEAIPLVSKKNKKRRPRRGSFRRRSFVCDTDKKNYIKYIKWNRKMKKRASMASSQMYRKWPNRPLINASALKSRYEDNKENNEFFFENCKKKCAKNRKNKKMWRKNPKYWEEYCEYCKPEEKPRRNLFSKQSRNVPIAPPIISKNPLLYTLPNPDDYPEYKKYAFFNRKDNRWIRTSPRPPGSLRSPGNFTKDNEQYHVFPPEYTYEMKPPCKFSDREIFELENTPYFKYSDKQKKASLNWLKELRDDLAKNYCCLDTEESEKCREILKFIKKKIKALELVDPQVKKIYCPICKKQFEGQRSFRKHFNENKIKKGSHPLYLYSPGRTFFQDRGYAYAGWYDYPRPDYSELSEEINPNPRLDADMISEVDSFVGSSTRKPFSEY